MQLGRNCNLSALNKGAQVLKYRFNNNDLSVIESFFIPEYAFWLGAVK
jgi:hypothetical protein